MAITTNDGLIAAIAGKKTVPFFKLAIGGTLVAGRSYSFLTISGNPGALTLPSTLAGSNTDGTTLAGSLPYINAGVGNQKYLSGLFGSAQAAGTLRYYDLLWWNGGITVTSTSAQTINSAAFPARDDNGTTNGEGLELWLFNSATMGAGTPTITVSYTNSDNTAGRSAVATGIATMVAGTMLPLTLQAGDKGVRSIQSITQSATWTSGTYHLLLMRKVGQLEFPVAGLGQSKNFYDLGLKLYDGTCIVGQWMPTTTAGAIVTTDVEMIEG